MDMTPESIKKYQWDENNPLGYYNRMGIYKTKIEYDFIEKYLNDKRLKILDIGGGSGRFALPILRNGFDITVIDLDKEAIDICIQKGILKSYCIDIKKFNQKYFDIALAIELFLVSSPEEILKSANQALNNDGILIFVGTNKKSWRYFLRSLLRNKSKNYGEYSINEYKSLIEQCGFSILDIRGFNWMPFRVNSNNSLIPLFASFESLFRLDKWLKQSPWFLFSCQKIRNVL